MLNKILIFYKKYGMFVLLVVSVVGFSIASPKTFFSTTTLWNVLKQASILGVVSCGVTILLITGGIDISIGARMGFITVLVGKMLETGVNIYSIIFIAIALGIISGAFNAFLCEVLHTYMFVVSMVMMYVWIGVCYLSIGPATMYRFPIIWKNLAQYQLFGHVPSIILWFIGCALLAGFVLEKTYFGRYIYAIGGNREAAYLAGINVKKVSILANAFSGAFIGIASILLTSRVMTATALTSSSAYAFDAITACVLGGVLLAGGSGRMYQAILGVLVLNVLFNGLTIIHVSDYWQMVIKGMVLALAIGLEVLQRYAKVDLSEKKDDKPAAGTAATT